MPQTIHVQARLSHRYRDAWSAMDQWKYLGTAKQLPPRVVALPVNYDDATVSLMTVELPAGLKGPERKAYARALVQTLSGSHCTHEYDCCGCITTWARVLHRNRRRITVRLSAQPNY